MAILAAVDFSPVSKAVYNILPGITEGQEPVVLMHVAEPNPAFVGFEAGPDVVQQQIESEFAREKAQLEAAAQALQARGVRAMAEQPHGTIAESIIERAEQIDARVIVLGSHGHGALYDLIVGSVAEAVIRKASRPVLLVPAQG